VHECRAGISNVVADAHLPRLFRWLFATVVATMYLGLRACLSVDPYTVRSRMRI